MNHEALHRPPYGLRDCALRHGDEGVYWRAGHGMVIRLAAAEREPETESRLGEVSPLEAWRGIAAG